MEVGGVKGFWQVSLEPQPHLLLFLFLLHPAHYPLNLLRPLSFPNGYDLEKLSRWGWGGGVGVLDLPPSSPSGVAQRENPTDMKTTI